VEQLGPVPVPEPTAHPKENITSDPSSNVAKEIWTGRAEVSATSKPA
jgi:hypothetical protein